MSWNLWNLRRSRSPGFGALADFDLTSFLRTFYTEPDFLWVAGDEDSPEIGPTAGLVGTSTEVEAALTIANGSSISVERFGAASYRTTAPNDVNPGTDDIVVVACFEQASSTGNRAFGGIRRSGVRGWNLLTFSSSLAISAIVQGSSQTSISTGSVAVGAGCVATLVIDRDGNTTLRANDSNATPVATPVGTMEGDGVGLGAYPDGVIPGETGIGYLAIWHGAAIADDWDAARIQSLYNVVGIV